jgi:hypothetical protein
MMLLALASLLVAPAGPAPSWEHYQIEGGQAWLDTNSVLDNGRYRSILFRIDGAAGGEDVFYVSRIEVDCSARQLRVRNVAIYDRRWRELMNHRLAARPFAPPGHAMRVVNAACNSRSARPDPVPADAPSTYSAAISTICGQAREQRERGSPDWLDRVARAIQLSDEQRGRLQLDCEAYDRGRSDAGR